MTIPTLNPNPPRTKTELDQTLIPTQPFLRSEPRPGKQVLEHRLPPEGRGVGEGAEHLLVQELRRVGELRLRHVFCEPAAGIRRCHPLLEEKKTRSTNGSVFPSRPSRPPILFAP